MYPNIINCPTSKPKHAGVVCCHHLIEKCYGVRAQSEDAKVTCWVRRGLCLAVSISYVMIFLSTALLLPNIVWAGRAELFIHPTLVELNSRERSATVNIVNRGDATGVFVINWVDFTMTAEGGLRKWEGPASWSLQPYVRYSPRRVTLKPGETQLVKIALRQQRDAIQGEYYSHFRVMTLNGDVDSAMARDIAGDTSLDRTVRIEARSAIAIPVVWRNSTSVPRAAIESVKLRPDLSQLVVVVRRLGELSTRGYLHVVNTGADGARRALTDPVPLVIYPTLERRVVTIPLRASSSNAILKDSAEVVYASGLDIASAKSPLASSRVTP